MDSRTRPTPRRGRPSKKEWMELAVARDLCRRFLLERGPDFRGTRRRLDSILRDFRAFATGAGWTVTVHGSSGFLALLRSARRSIRNNPARLAAYEEAKRRATRDRAKKRAEIEAKRKR